jgi:DNA polymerase-3 subunit delta'
LKLEEVGEKSHIIITTDFEAIKHQLQNLYQTKRVVWHEYDDLLVDSVKAIMKEAYIAESSLKTIIVMAKNFTPIAQNALLKVLEEPPRNIRFILVSPTKSNLLPTIRSRLLLITVDTKKLLPTIDLQLKSVGLEHIYAFIQEHKRTSKEDAKSIIEGLMHQAVYKEKLTLKDRQLDAFRLAFESLESNANVQAVLMQLLLEFYENL